MNNLTQAEIQKCWKAGALTAQRAMELMEQCAPASKSERSILLSLPKPVNRRATRKAVKTKNSMKPWQATEEVALVEFIKQGRDYKSAAVVFQRSPQACALRYRKTVGNRRQLELRA